MSRKVLVRCVLAAVTFSAAASTVAWAAEYLPRDLALGDRGADVTNLQVALNLDPWTQLAASGAGAPGEETDYFGPLTAAAVARYQEVKGLPVRDGAVSGSTRDLLAADLSRSVSGAAAPQARQTSSTPLDLLNRAITAGNAQSQLRSASAPIVFADLIPPAESGRSVSIFGYNFKAGEAYNLIDATSSKVFASGVATSSISMVFKAPRLKAGEYRVYVEGSNGRSRDFTFVLGGKSRPSIDKVTPSTIKIGDTVTITGSRFGRKGVKVISSFGEVENVTFKSGKITFTSELGADLPPTRAPNGATTTVPVTLRVQNAKGASDPVIVYVEI